MDPYKFLLGYSVLNHTLTVDLIHVIIAAPKLLLPIIKFKVIEAFKIVEKWFYHVFMKLHNLTEEFDWIPYRDTVVLF